MIFDFRAKFYVHNKKGVSNNSYVFKKVLNNCLENKSFDKVNKIYL